MTRYYEFTSKPRYWVVHDDEGYWLVPAVPGGWDQRSPFVGRVAGLRELTDFDGIALGLPAGS